MLNNGQSCIAAKRFIVSEAIADEFQQKLLAKFQTLKVGDPMSEDTDIGPLATASIRDEIADQVQKSVEMGAKVLIGGKPLAGKGNFYPPTILTEIPVESPANTEEFFGPVALFFRVKNIDEAIALANATPLGLGASVWTNNEQERDRAIEEIEAGAIFVNGLVKSDPRLPFGGIKRSGYGRELSIQGIHEFVNIKTVWIK
jgi:succinate-semialdehyde dehydrogenase/glutarate-semialdehyde dehydrogenase